jgi:Lrp/AsnC family transcriptional regulator for asnA, asnC and gidA
VRGLDQIDISILAELFQDARTPFRKIAKELGVSPDTITNRYLAMRKQDVLTGAAIVIDPRKVGYRAMAAFMIDVSAGARSEGNVAIRDSTSIFNGLVKVPNVINVRKTVGDHDLLAIVIARDFEHLTKIREDILGIPGIKDMEICFWTGTPELPRLHNLGRLIKR